MIDYLAPHISIVIVLFISTGAMAAASAADEIEEDEIGIEVEGGYVTKYLWKGYDILDNNGAWQTSITIDYKGFYAGVWGSWADKRGFVAQDELDYYVGYERSFLGEDEYRYTLDTFVTYTYFDFPKSDSISGDDGVADGQELALGFSMPNLFPLGPSFLIPSYEGDFEWAGMQPSDDVDKGWIHTFGLSYDIPVPVLVPEQEEQFLSLSWSLSYNDGVFESDPGWSHSTAALATIFEWKGISFTPIIYYQWSFEDTVNEENEFYTSFSFDYYF
jgi:hypothetical protein